MLDHLRSRLWTTKPLCHILSVKESYKTNPIFKKWGNWLYFLIAEATKYLDCTFPTIEPLDSYTETEANDKGEYISLYISIYVHI